MDEKQFFEQIFEFFGESFRRFNLRNETYKNDEYAKATAPQYAELKKYLHDLKGLKGEKNIVRINELDDDETIYYFVENNDKMYVIQIDDIL